MTIEIRTSFLGIPLSRWVELSPGETLQGDTSVDWGFLPAILSDWVGDSYLKHIHTDRSREIKVIDEQTIEGPRGKERTIFRSGEINKARLGPTIIIPGLKGRVRFK